MLLSFFYKRRFVIVYSRFTSLIYLAKNSEKINRNVRNVSLVCFSNFFSVCILLICKLKEIQFNLLRRKALINDFFINDFMKRRNITKPLSFENCHKNISVIGTLLIAWLPIQGVPLVSNCPINLCYSVTNKF